MKQFEASDPRYIEMADLNARKNDTKDQCRNLKDRLRFFS